MHAKKKVTGTAMAMPVGLAVAAIISLTITLIGSAVVSYMVAAEKMGVESIGYAANAILAIAAMVGALSANSFIHKMRLQVCMLSGACYYVMLLAITALFFGGRYQGMLTTAIIIILGCGLVAVIPPKNGRTWKFKKRAYR